MDQIELTNKLNFFSEADTSSELLGKIDAGIYDVLEIKENHPDTSTDYVQLFNPESQRSVWICSRYQETKYGRLVSIDDESATSAPSLTIDEQFLTNLLPEFVAFRYDLHQPSYPFPLTGIKVPQAPPALNNCCTFVEALLVKAWQDAGKIGSWSNRSHSQMMIFSSEDYFSPVSCLVKQGMATLLNVDHAPQPWTIVQGWKSQWKGGHTFLILDHHQESDRVLTLESNKAFQLDGVGYRALGNLRDLPHPGNQWWHNDAMWTWEKLKSTYPHRKQAKLQVDNVSWVSSKEG